MYFNFGLSEPMEVLIEQYIGNACVSRQKLSAPPEFLQAQFLQLIQQVVSQSQPMKIKIVRWEDVWDNFDGKWKKIECYVEFKNWKDDGDG